MRRLLPALALLAACAGAGRLFDDLLRPGPAAPLEQLEVTSDARIDPAGWLRGSLVGEGTARAVHLLSSDTAFIAGLVRQYRPDIAAGGDLWASLARAGLVTIDPQRIRALAADPSAGRVLVVASPEGHAEAALVAVVVRGSTCGWRGAQAELIVEQAGARPAAYPSLRGPVVGSFRLAGEVSGRFTRRAPAEPSEALAALLVERTGAAMDSLLDGRLPARDRPLRRPPTLRPLVNSLADVDAADLLAIQAADGVVRHAVALRERRVTARGDTAVAAIVMVWDSAGTWQQVVLGPTLLDLRRHRLVPRSGWPAAYWRRLHPVNAFEYRRDYIWLEQVRPRDGSVLWGVVDPRGNVVVAAAEVESGCR